MNRRESVLPAAAAVLSSAAALAAVALGTLDAPAGAAAPGAAAATGNAKGSFTFAKQQVPLTHAYATLVDDVEGTRLSGPQKALHVLLADAPVPAEARTDHFKCADLVRSGKLKAAVELRYDPARKELFGASLYSAAASPQGHPMNVSLAGEGRHRLQNLKVGPDAVSGIALMTEADEWLRPEMDGQTFRYRAEFRAPLTRPTPVTATLTGKAALDSPQAAAVLALLTAILAKDIEAVRRAALPNPQMEEAYRTTKPEEFWKMAESFAPTPAGFRKSLQKIIVRGDREATILFGEGERMRVVLQSGTWKVSN